LEKRKGSSNNRRKKENKKKKYDAGNLGGCNEIDREKRKWSEFFEDSDETRRERGCFLRLVP
jgi:hypothetical protein